MQIMEAVREALENDLCITVPEFRGTAKIKPTNGPELCIVMLADSTIPSKYGWQPSAQDLIRDDWEVVSREGTQCRGVKGVSGPSSIAYFDIPDGVWTEKHAILQGLCTKVLKFMVENPEISDSVRISNGLIWSYKRRLKRT